MNRRFETFVLSIHQIYRCIQTLKCREMTELGLKGTHVMCLFQLWNAPGGVTAAELTALCRQDKAAISRALARLTELGLVAPEQEGGGRRYRTPLRLTETGRAVTGRMMDRIDWAVELGGQGLTEAQRTAMYEALALVARNLTALCDREESV
ncbi:MAG: MarR family winged helix-turn-helix transcriptional regulator [Gemmiger sp.]